MILATIAALSDVKLPGVKDDGTGKVVLDAGSMSHSLEINSLCVPLTYTIADGNFLADPTFEEEKLSGHAVSIVMDQNGLLAGVTKLGGCTVSDADLQACIKGAQERSKAVGAMLGL